MTRSGDLPDDGVETALRTLVVRVFADCATASDATTVAAQVKATVRSSFPTSKLTRERVERYWKISEWFEIALNFEVEAATADADLRRVVDDLPSERTVVGGSLVWNKKPSSTIIDPTIQWASLELIDEGRLGRIERA